MKNNKEFIIFSLDTRDIKTSLEDGAAILRVNHIPFKRVIGTYKNTQEVSYLVPSVYQDQVLRLAKEMDQESILEVDGNKNAVLRYIEDGRVERLGRFTKVSEDEALNLDSWTRDIQTGDYYAVR